MEVSQAPSHVFLVTRVITTAHKTSVSIPMGAFDGKDGAVAFQARMGKEVNGILSMQVIGHDGTTLDMTVGGVLAGLGITQVGHVRHGPVEVTVGSGIIETVSAGSRLVLPRGAQRN